jgi:hypothetical protein
MSAYTGPERRLRPRPVSTFQRLMDVSFQAARKLESSERRRSCEEDPQPSQRQPVLRIFHCGQCREDNFDGTI